MNRGWWPKDIFTAKKTKFSSRADIFKMTKNFWGRNTPKWVHHLPHTQKTNFHKKHIFLRGWVARSLGRRPKTPHFLYCLCLSKQTKPLWLPLRTGSPHMGRGSPQNALQHRPLIGHLQGEGVFRCSQDHMLMPPWPQMGVVRIAILEPPCRQTPRPHAWEGSPPFRTTFCIISACGSKIKFAFLPILW